MISEIHVQRFSVEAEERAAERARCAAILCDQEAERRQDHAKHLAFNTNFSALNAIAVLATCMCFKADE